MSFIFRVCEETFTKQHSLFQESSRVMKDFENLELKKPKAVKKKKEEPSQPNFTVRSNELIKNRKEKDYTGSYCRDTFRKHKLWKQGLSKEEQNENDSGLLIEKPKETYKAFNSIELFDVIGCLKSSRPFHPKSYIVISKNKEDETIVVIPWHASWLEQEHTKDSITQHYKEYIHQNKGLNLDNKLSIVDIGLSVSLERFVKLYKLDKTKNRFVVPSEDVRKVKIVRFVKQEDDKSGELTA